MVNFFLMSCRFSAQSRGGADAASRFLKVNGATIAAMDISRIPLFAAMSKRMAWLSQRQTVLADNVANANTPGYAAKDLKDPDFRRLVPKPGAIQLAATQPNHIVQAPRAAAGTEVVTAPTDESIDGNGVSLEEQMMKVSTNASDFALVSSLYKDQIGLIKTALGVATSG
jgi:flagellar basal-body rod protein FlgB